MKTHFYLEQDKSNSATTVVFLEKGLAADSAVDVRFVKKNDGLYHYSATTAEAPPNKLQTSVMRALSDVFADSNTADAVVKKVLALGGRQVVWDDNQEKYRNVSTMKDGEHAYQALAGGLTFTVTAPHEERAKARMSNKITAAMATTPAKATQLAAWFAEGQKVTKVQSGDAPEALALSVLGGLFAKEDAEVKKELAKAKQAARKSRKPRKTRNDG